MGLSLDKLATVGVKSFLFHYSTVLDFIGLANYVKASFNRKESKV